VPRSRAQPATPVRNGRPYIFRLLRAALLLGLGSGLLAARGWAQAPARTLDQVLTAIDLAAPQVRGVEAAAESQKYTKVVDDLSTESGTLDYRKQKRGPQLLLTLRKPAVKVFLYRDETAWIYQPAIAQVQKYNLRKNHALVEQFLLLGLGGSGHALERSFHVRLVGAETLAGRGTVHLQLTPLAGQRGLSSIDLWYDTQLWIAIQQKFLQSSGDYQQLRYSQIKINPHISEELFEPHFNGAQVIEPR